ncbi:hypothetical protein HDU96_007271 [Phlyctochytrium bullatum]|nr:hypothetical protein HDU96_007271 [Phlyctochytrium bullatum]
MPPRKSLPLKFLRWWANTIREALCLDLIALRYEALVYAFAIWLNSAELLGLAIAKFLLLLDNEVAVSTSIFENPFAFPEYAMDISSILCDFLLIVVACPLELNIFALVKRLLQHPLTEVDTLVGRDSIFSAAMSRGADSKLPFVRTAMLRVLLEHGCDPNLRDSFQKTPLMLAAENKSIRDIRLLLDYGADPSYMDNRGYNVLHVAASHCFYHGALAILDHLSANKQALQNCLNFCSFSGTPLMIAVNRCSLRLVELFLKRGANVLAEDFFRGRTAIDYALQPDLREEPGRFAVADALLERMARRRKDCDEEYVKGIIRQLRRTDLEMFLVFRKYTEFGEELKAVLAEEPVPFELGEEDFDDEDEDEFPVDVETDTEGSRGNVNDERFDNGSDTCEDVDEDEESDEEWSDDLDELYRDLEQLELGH